MSIFLAAMQATLGLISFGVVVAWMWFWLDGDHPIIAFGVPMWLILFATALLS